MLQAADEIILAPWATYGPLGLITVVFIGWITVGARWIANKWQKATDASTAALERNTMAFERNSAAFDSWKRSTEGLSRSIESFNESSAECRKVVVQIASHTYGGE